MPTVASEKHFLSYLLQEIDKIAWLTSQGAKYMESNKGVSLTGQRKKEAKGVASKVTATNIPVSNNAEPHVAELDRRPRL